MSNLFFLNVKGIVMQFAIGILLVSCSIMKGSDAKTKNKNADSIGLINVDSARGLANDSTKRSKPRKYGDVITANAISNRGLFTIHQIEERYYFEIPDSLLEREILVVNRIAKAATNHRPRGVLGYAGDQIGEKVIKLSKGPSDRLFIKIVSFVERSLDSSENGMYRTVQNSNLMPIIASFNITAYTADSSASVVDMTDFLNSENSLLNFDAPGRAAFGLGALQKERSFITGVKTFPINVELRSVNTYVLNDFSATYELNNSFLLLPEDPMKPRFRDARVGYFYRSYVDYDAPQSADYEQIITRWRLEPKEEDKPRYLNGELVEPKKPIIFYIDPATPKKWISYLIQGVNDWQKAFEKAGFKNAIYALEAPANDPEWDLYDARHNAIIYKASLVPNASGPNIHDPRSGEILESHINWYHNVTELLHDWYMIQAGANDPRARTMIFSDSLMGRLIRFVACHEVGHTLGLMHNFGASSTVPVDSLRSKTFLRKNGFCASIMDYARFNYVAQPEDGICVSELLPRIGVYDEWAIEWGYRWFNGLGTVAQEKTHLNQWVVNNIEKNPQLWYGPQDIFGAVVDPRSQYEDLGDDAIKASNYGIQNLKRVYQNLVNWTKVPNESYESLERMQDAVFVWFNLYLFHVCNNTGLFMQTEKTVEQHGAKVSFVSKKRQKEALRFVSRQVFDTPFWLLNDQIYLRTGKNPIAIIPSIQMGIINYLFNFRRYWLMTYNQIMNPSDAYSFDEFLTDLEKEVFKEFDNKLKIDFHRRNLQTFYIEKLIKEAETVPSSDRIAENEKLWKFGTGYNSIVYTHIEKILLKINKILPSINDVDGKRHLVRMRQRLKHSINADAFPVPSFQNSANTINVEKLFSDYFKITKRQKQNETSDLPRGLLNCWQNYELFMSLPDILMEPER